MSNGYGVDFFGVATYGYSQPSDYSVAPFNAYQTDYLKITLKWLSPNKTLWKSLQLVRSVYGYPSSPADGVQLLTVVPSAMTNTYDDTNLTAGKIYYYTMFLSLEAPTWSNANTYGVGQVVLYNNQYWSSLTVGNINNTPVVGSSFWQSTVYQPIWYPAGYTASLALKNYGYTSLLYNRTPQPYKVSNSDLFANTVVDNPALFHYLSLFGFHLDMTKTEYDLYLQGNNPDIISAVSLDVLGQQLGFTTDYISTPQLRRQRVKNTTVNYRLKGTAQSIHNAIAAITGWDSVVTDSINMLQDGDQAAFAHPRYDLWNPATTYFVNQLVQFNGFNYKNLLQSYGQAQAPSGTSSANTWWQAQISGTSSQLTDTTVLKNPTNYVSGGPDGTGGFSTWYPTPTGGYSGTIQQNGIVTGLPHPTDNTINNWNALAYVDTQTALSVSLANSSAGIPVAPNWSNSTNYVINNWVTSNSVTYIAKRPSGPGTPYGFITPGTNDTFWYATFIPISPSPNRVQYLTDGVPLIQYRQWDSSITYQIGTQILYFGIVYQAININKNSKPSGYYYSNKDWIYIQPAENIYTASAYQTRLTTNTTAKPSFMDVEIYDSLNNSQDFFNNATNSFLARFDGDYSDLNGINDNTLASLGRPWTATPSTAKLWRSNYGMATVDQSLFGTTTYVYLTIASGISDILSGITFVTDYTDAAHIGHGIIFRFQDANNFWYTTRKTLYKVVGGVETSMATWTRLLDGDRMLVVTNGSAILVYKYVRDGTNTNVSLANITDAALQTATVHGLIQKYSPSGAV
jgi:hypothetical protein